MKSYTHIWLAKRRYGAATSTHGRSAQYAYVDGRIHVPIDYIFQTSITHGTVHLTSIITIIRKFKTSEITSRIEFPWSLRYVLKMKKFFGLIFIKGGGLGGRCLGCRAFSSTRDCCGQLFLWSFHFSTSDCHATGAVDYSRV